MKGKTYRHFKGNLYYVLDVAEYVGKHEAPDDPTDPFCKNAPLAATGFPSGTKMVTYIGLYDNPHGNRPCVRTLQEFTEDVDYRGMRVQRFREVSS